MNKSTRFQRPGLPKRNRRILSRWFFIFALIAVIAVFMLVYVWERVQVVLLAKEIDALKKQETELAEQNTELQAQLERLSDFSTLGKAAQEKLGMTFPPKELVYLPERWQELLKEESENESLSPLNLSEK